MTTPPPVTLQGTLTLRSAPPDTQALESVATARTRTLDALAGFQKMAEHAEPDFAPIVHAFVDLHDRHAGELTRILSEAGQVPDEGGSLMGSVNRLVVATRALFDEIDADVLTQIHTGEEHVANAYAAVLAANVPQDVRDRIARLQTELHDLLADARPVD